MRGISLLNVTLNQHRLERYECCLPIDSVFTLLVLYANFSDKIALISMQRN